MLAEGAREMIRKIVREEQASLIQEQEEEQAVKKEQLHAKMEKQFEEMREKQKKRLEEWIMKFCEKAGLTITEEQGMLEAYRWAQEERNRMLRDRREEGPPLLLGPEQFAKIAEQRDEKIRELLSAAKFDEFDKYRSSNPLPEMAYFGAVGPDGVEADAIIIEAGPMSGKKEEKSEEEDK
jgi:hypothetical protein